MSDINITVNDEIVNIDVIDTPVVVEVSNAPGPAGAGVAVGGTTGQVLAKASNTNYDTVWVNPSTGGVPYSGATGNVNLGEYELKAGQVEFDQTPTGTAGVGVMRWNDADGTVDLGLKGGNVTLQVGQEQVARVVNKTGANLLESEYKVVKVTSAQGQRLAVDLAQANNDNNSADTLGIVTENIDNNQEGFITTMGTIRGINTTGSLQGETWTDGDVLYLSGTTAGAITNVKPTAPLHIVVVGYVEYAHVNNGKIYVKVMNGWEIDELHNVLISSPTDNQGLFYNSTSTLWENKSITTALGYTPVPTTRNITINGVTYDLSADRTWTIAAGISGSGASGQVTYWTGASAVSGSNNLTFDGSRLTVLGSINVSSVDSGDASLISNRGFIVFRDTSNTITNRFRGISSGFSFQDASYNTRAQISTSNGLSYLNAAGGNVSIGSGSDLGVRLGVVGDTLLRGSGNTSATTALTVQNSDSTNMWRFLNNGDLLVGTTSEVTLRPNNGTITSPQLSGRGLTINIAHISGTGSGVIINNVNGDRTATSGVSNTLLVQNGFAPTSGTGQFNMIVAQGTINQTGGANGITRGLYVNPTLTAAADFRAIETSAGNVLIGTNANQAAGVFITNSSTGNNQRSVLRVINNTGENGTFSVWGSATGLPNKTLFESSKDFIIGTDSNTASGGTSKFQIYVGGYNAVTSPQLSFHATANLSIGSTADNGQRLQVYGDTLLRGSGATSATTALTVQNSSSTNLFTVRNDGLSTFYNNTSIQRNFNGFLNLEISNSTAGTDAYSAITVTAALGSVNFGKYSNLKTAYKIVASGDGYFYNSTQFGDMAFLNDFATGKIKFAAGASSTSQLTIKANGTINMSSLPTSSTGLVAGDLWNNGGVINIV